MRYGEGKDQLIRIWLSNFHYLILRRSVPLLTMSDNVDMSGRYVTVNEYRSRVLRLAKFHPLIGYRRAF